MTNKTITIKPGTTLKIEFVRKVQDKVSYADGYNIVTGREVVEYTNFTFFNESGKSIARGRDMTMLHPKFDAAMTAKGAAARIGDAYIRQEIADKINAAVAELEAENPKSEEQLAIEKAQAEAHARWEAELPAMMEAEAFERKMNRADSDY